MISQSHLKEVATWGQTTELNIRREYIQHLFLSNFYRRRNVNSFYFKGGTALRLIFHSPRFSEDLDFSLSSLDIRSIENEIIDTLKEIEREDIYADIIESKQTTGGYLSKLLFHLKTDKVELILQMSKREKSYAGEVVTVNNEFLPPYTIFILDRRKLVAEKVQALLTRAKPRDYYDFYFLLRAGLIQNKNKQVLAKVKEKLKTDIDFKKELQGFLPKSHWPLIKTLPAAIGRELARFR
jgi:predicted nucleotidyltransferase component of viral defense system